MIFHAYIFFSALSLGTGLRIPKFDMFLLPFEGGVVEIETMHYVILFNNYVCI